MKNSRPKADVAIVGLGWCGSLIAEELTRAGLNVVAIERGPWFETATDFPPSVDTDELRWDIRIATHYLQTVVFISTPSAFMLNHRLPNMLHQMPAFLAVFRGMVG